MGNFNFNTSQSLLDLLTTKIIGQYVTKAGLITNTKEMMTRIHSVSSSQPNYDVEPKLPTTAKCMSVNKQGVETKASMSQSIA